MTPTIIEQPVAPLPPQWVEILAQPIDLAFGCWQVERGVYDRKAYRLKPINTPAAYLTTESRDLFGDWPTFAAKSSVEAVRKALWLIREKVSTGAAQLDQVIAGYDDSGRVLPGDDDTAEIPVPTHELGGEG